MVSGAFSEGPIESRDYKRGYLCGAIRGDGHLAMRVYERDGRSWQQNQFRLAMTDFEALARAPELRAPRGGWLGRRFHRQPIDVAPVIEVEVQAQRGIEARGER